MQKRILANFKKLIFCHKRSLDFLQIKFLFFPLGGLPS